MRVLKSAELGALAAIDSRFLNGEPGRILLSRDEIHLARQTGYPEGVDDIRRVECQLHDSAEGDMNLVGGDEAVARHAVLVAHLPPPLMTHDFDIDFSVAAMGEEPAVD